MNKLLVLNSCARPKLTSSTCEHRCTSWVPRNIVHTASTMSREYFQWFIVTLVPHVYIGILVDRTLISFESTVTYVSTKYSPSLPLMTKPFAAPPIQLLIICPLCVCPVYRLTSRPSITSNIMTSLGAELTIACRESVGANTTLVRAELCDIILRSANEVSMC